jgi:protein-S-isoprenylcysteine O-methyltransferase Ste14
MVRTGKILKKSGTPKSKGNDEKIPRSFILGVSAFCTMVFWFIVIIYPFLVFFEALDKLSSIFLEIRFPYDFILHWFGLSLIVFGFTLFDWSIIVRGRYATSWKMRENHKLVTWGPYALVRHPSYLSYFIMFFGLLFLWPNLLTLIPIFAIPGYIQITNLEEKMLIKKFGNQYEEYQKKVGRFLPRKRKPKTKINKRE